MKDLVNRHKEIFFIRNMLMSEQVSESCSVPPTLYDHMEFSRPEYWSGQPFPSPGDLPNPGIELGSPALQADSLPAEPQRKPKNGVGSLSLLQGIFPTQGLNPSHPHCRWILYQLSHKGSPITAGFLLLLKFILLLAVPGLHCWEGFSSVVVSRGNFLGEVFGLFSAVASLVVEHRIQSARVSVVAAPRPQITGSVCVACRLSCTRGWGIFPNQGSNLWHPWFLHWQGDFSLPSHQGSPIPSGFGAVTIWQRKCHYLVFFSKVSWLFQKLDSIFNRLFTQLVH